MKRFFAIVAAFCLLTLAAGAGFAADCNFVASKAGGKYHVPTCGTAKNIKDGNKVCFAYPEEAIQAGYSACGVCNPAQGTEVVASKDSEKYHLPTCGAVKNIKPENLVKYGSAFDAAKAGKTPCGVCKPPKVAAKPEIKTKTKQ